MDNALAYVVGPEDVHHLQGIDHEGHKQPWNYHYMPNLFNMLPLNIVKPRHVVVVGLKYGPTATGDVDNDPTANPGRKKKNVEKSYQCLAIVPIVLNSYIRYSVKAASTESKITQIVDEDDENSDEPVVGEVTEENEEGSQAMVQQVFIVVPLRLDQCMGDQPVEILSKGHQEIQFHAKGVFSERWTV